MTSSVFAVLCLLLAIQTAHAQSYPPPGRGQTIMMVRNTLIALNQANQTGNYTVIRDLASPAFRKANTAAALGLAFTQLRRNKYDLSPVLLVDPTFPKAPAVDKNNSLQIAGVFNTRPSAIHFDLRFQPVDGQWMLSGLAVTPRPVAETAKSKN